MAQTVPPTNVRYHYIDLMKGIACLLMLLGHGFRVWMVYHLNDTYRVLMYLCDFSGPMFFFASGMNIHTFIDRNQHKLNFRMDRFYVMSALVLFFLSNVYSFSVKAPGLPNIFHAVAMSTVFVYFLIRKKVPNSVIFAIAVALYMVYLPWRMGITPNYETIENYAGRPFAILLLINFSFLPWVCFFITGAVAFKATTKLSTGILIGIFSLMFASSFLFPKIVTFDTTTQLLFRGVPTYMLQTVGFSGLFYFFLRKVYHGAKNNRMLQTLEFWGKESFLFLIVHFFFLFLLPFPLVWLYGYYENVNGWLFTVLLFVFTLFSMPLTMRLRDRLAQKKRFITISVITIIFVWFSTAYFYSIPKIALLAIFWSYIGSFAFAFSYPSIRKYLRKRYDNTSSDVPIEPAAPQSEEPKTT